MNPAFPSNTKISQDGWLYAGFVLLKIAVHLATNGSGAYSYFRDEFYYLDCAAHLGWGYVDQPPLSLLILALTRAAIGDSMIAIRLPVVLIGAATVVLSGLIARQLGGGRFAQALTCLAVLTAPVFLSMSSFFSMNAFDQFFWVLAAYLIVRIINTDNPRLWIFFGLVAGLGLENKFSMAFFCFGIVAAMALTPLRKHFGTWHFWAGGLIVTVLFLPHILWQFANDWPTLEFMHNARLYKNMPATPLDFFLGQLLLIGPVAAPIWIAGLLYGLLSKAGRTFAVFFITYLILFAVFWSTNGKVYYLSPIYPVMLALGAVWLETLVQARRKMKGVVLVVVALSGIVFTPLAIPTLAPKHYLRYEAALGLSAPQQEKAHGGDLPQHLGDRLGWEEFVAMVAQAYHQLDPDQKSACSIFVSNYGEAGAINLVGRRYGLPRAITGHMSHYLWGPGDATGEWMLVYWANKEELDELFDEVIEVARFQFPHVMDRQNDRPLFLCHRLKIPISDVWNQVKAYR